MPQPAEPANALDANARALAFLRIAVGIFFLIFGEYKVFGTQFTLHGGFQFWIDKWLQEGGAYPFMAPVLKNFVLPHATPIAFLVAYGELSIGLALTLGILVRIASAGGLLFMLTLLFSSDYPGPACPSGNTLVPAWDTLFSPSVSSPSSSPVQTSLFRSDVYSHDGAKVMLRNPTAQPRLLIRLPLLSLRINPVDGSAHAPSRKLSR